MTPPETEPDPSPARLRWPHWCGLALLWAAFAGLWILPLVRPHGEYLWGHYRLRDLYPGIPVALATLGATGLALAPPGRRRYLAPRVAALGVSVTLMLFLCDALYTLGLMQAWKPNFWFDTVGITRRDHVPDAELGYRYRPRLRWHGRVATGRQVRFRLDENGFRNPPGVTRADLVVVGDSFTEGALVNEEQTFTQLLGERLGMRAVNLGCHGYGPQQELAVLRRCALRYHPRRIVFQVYEGNDLTDAARFAGWQRNPTQPTVSLPQRYLANSLLNQLLLWTCPRDRSGPPRVRYTVRHQDGTSDPALCWSPYRPDEPAQLPAAFAETERDLREARRLCRSRGVEFTVVFVPIRTRVLAPWISWEKAADKEWILPGGRDTDPRDFETRLGAYCRGAGMSYVDLFGPLRRAAETDNRELYGTKDEHLDVAGHRVVAAAIANALTADPAGKRAR